MRILEDKLKYFIGGDMKLYFLIFTFSLFVFLDIVSFVSSITYINNCMTFDKDNEIYILNSSISGSNCLQVFNRTNVTLVMNSYNVSGSPSLVVKNSTLVVISNWASLVGVIVNDSSLTMYNASVSNLKCYGCDLKIEKSRIDGFYGIVSKAFIDDTYLDWFINVYLNNSYMHDVCIGGYGANFYILSNCSVSNISTENYPLTPAFDLYDNNFFFYDNGGEGERVSFTIYGEAKNTSIIANNLNYIDLVFENSTAPFNINFSITNCTYFNIAMRNGFYDLGGLGCKFPHNVVVNATLNYDCYDSFIGYSEELPSITNINTFIKLPESCNHNGKCDYPYETQSNCPEDCKTKLDSNLTSDPVDVNVSVEDSRVGFPIADVVFLRMNATNQDTGESTEGYCFDGYYFFLNGTGNLCCECNNTGKYCVCSNTQCDNTAPWYPSPIEVYHNKGIFKLHTKCQTPPYTHTILEVTSSIGSLPFVSFNRTIFIMRRIHFGEYNLIETGIHRKVLDFNPPYSLNFIDSEYIGEHYGLKYAVCNLIPNATYKIIVGHRENSTEPWNYTITHRIADVIGCVYFNLSFSENNVTIILEGPPATTSTTTTIAGGQVYQTPFIQRKEVCSKAGEPCIRDTDCCEGVCLNNRCKVFCGEGFCCPLMEGSPYFPKPCPDQLQCCLNDYPQDPYRGVCKEFCCSMENESCIPPHYCCYGLKCVNGRCVRPVKKVVSPWIWVVIAAGIAALIIFR